MANANKFSSFGQGILQVLGRKQAAEQAHKELMLSLTLPMKFKAQQAELERKAKYRDALLRYSEEKKAQDREATLRRDLENQKSQIALIVASIKAQGGEGEQPKPVTPGEQLSFTKWFGEHYELNKEDEKILGATKHIENWMGLSDTQKKQKVFKEEYPLLSSIYEEFPVKGKWSPAPNVVQEDASKYYSALGVDPNEFTRVKEKEAKRNIAYRLSEDIIGATSGMTKEEYQKATSKFPDMVDDAYENIMTQVQAEIEKNIPEQTSDIDERKNRLKEHFGGLQ